MLRRFILALALAAAPTASFAATLISAATGNWTDAGGTWLVANATALLDSEVSSTVLTTSYVDSSAFTPGAITVDQICVKGALRAASPTGTMTIRLYNSTAGSEVLAVAINVSDLHVNSTGGWTCVGFSDTLLLAATDYKIGAKTSSSSQFNLYRDATAGNWSRLLRTTTAAAPAAGDNLVVVGECTAAATCSSYTITMNETATTDYGSAAAVVYPAALSVSQYGTLTWGVAASTTYNLKLSGWLAVNAGGTYNQGTTGARMPGTSDGILTFDCAADGDFGINVRAGGTFQAHGAETRSWTLLQANVAAAGTVLTVSDTTGWAVSDDVALAPTARTYNEYETRTIQTVDSSTQVTLTAGVTYAHEGDGTAPFRGEVLNLTRNVVITSASATAPTFLAVYGAGTVVNISCVLFRYISEEVTGKRGLEVMAGFSGTITVDRCAFRDAESYAVLLGSSTAGGVHVFTNNSLYNVGVTDLRSGFHVVVSVPSVTITGNAMVNSAGTSAGYGFNSVEAAITFNDNRCAGSNNTSGNSGSCVQLSENGTGLSASGNVIHSTRGDGLRIFNVIGGTFTNFVIARSSAHGIYLLPIGGITFSDGVVVGNITSGLYMGGAVDAVFSNMVVAAESSYSQTNGIAFNTGGNAIHVVARFNSSTFGSGCGTCAVHTTADINVGSTLNSNPEIVLSNTTLASATELTGLNGHTDQTVYVASQRADTTAGNHWIERPAGRVVRDTTFDSDSSGESARMTPRSVSVKLRQIVGTAPVVSGGTVTASWQVRESEVADGTAYNGARAILYVLRNTALGISSDTALDTATASSDGAWVTLSGTTATVTDAGVLEFAVDVDGTTGWVNVDAGSAANMTWNLNEWENGGPARLGTASVGGGGGGLPILGGSVIH